MRKIFVIKRRPAGPNPFDPVRWHNPIGILRITIKLPLIGAFLVFGALACALTFPTDWNKPGLTRRRNFIRWWLSVLARLIGIRIQVSGAPTESTALVVSNHISWMDIVIIGSTRPVSFLSKIEIARWPIVGYLARKAGTLFINRGDGATVATRLIGERLQAGVDVAFFPEGTTSDGTAIHRFHPRLFTSALEARVPVQPVFVTYPCKKPGHAVHPKAPSKDRPFFLHAVMLLAEPRIDAVVHYTDAVHESNDRTRLAEKAHDLIAARHLDRTG